MKAIDWIARTAMLVLASLATLALIGSLASVSDSALGDAFPGTIERTEAARTGGRQEPVAAGERVSDRSGEPIATTSVTRVAPPPRDETARWLKALTYAVIALAAFAAAGVVALVRIAGHLDRRMLR